MSLCNAYWWNKWQWHDFWGYDGSLEINWIICYYTILISDNVESKITKLKFGHKISRKSTDGRLSMAQNKTVVSPPAQMHWRYHSLAIINMMQMVFLKNNLPAPTPWLIRSSPRTSWWSSSRPRLCYRDIYVISNCEALGQQGNIIISSFTTCAGGADFS